MNEPHLPKAPFETLGKHLKYLREQHQESLAEVSGAVEIEEGALERIEQGVERPAEDILLLLINHFGMQDQEAVQLWELAGYEAASADKFQIPDDLPPLNGRSVVMLLAVDVRTMYSDGVEITANPAGVTLNFTQASGQTQPVPVARIGMSYEQAEMVLNVLNQALLRGKYLRGPKGLPPGQSE